MKRLMMALVFVGFSNATAVSASPAPQDASAGVSASFGDADYFYSGLAPYGEWLELDAGFYAWRPTHVRYGWRPYLQGRWAWTDYGWYWISNEPFGWATYHYGRWYYDNEYGWVWVPDRTWGPAWVEWRYNDDYLGWAPLPPYASFGINIGIRFTTRWFAPDHYWNFVRYRYLTSPYLFQAMVPTEYARRLISTTRSAGRYEFENGRIINRGVDRELVERRGGYTRIDRLDVRESRDVGERLVRNTNSIEVYRPDRNGTDRAHERIDARRAGGGTSLDLQKIERGGQKGFQTTGPRGYDRGRRSPGLETRAPQVPSVEQKEIERRKEDRYPFRQNQQVDRSRSSAQRNVAMDKTQSTRNQGIRQAPSVRKESPRGSGRGRREGTRRRG